MKNAFYSLMNVFRSDKNIFCIWRNAFFVIPYCYGMVFSRFKIVLHLNRKLSEPFFFGMVRIGFCQDEIAFFNVSLKKLVRMDSSNWRTCSSQSNIIPSKKRTCSLLFSKLLECFLMNSKISFKKIEYVLIRSVS